MRLAPAVDLVAVLAAALAEVDRAFSVRMATSPLAAAWAEKERRARAMLAGGADDVLLVDEARDRGVAPDDLARSVVSAAEAAARALMTIEAQRQALKARLRAAPHQHAINALLAGISAP